MFQAIASAVLVGALSVAAIYTITQHNHQIKEDLAKTREIKLNQKISTMTTPDKMKLSTLVQATDLSDSQKEKLNHFQEAVNITVIKNNIEDPTCSDLSATGLISLSDCNEIKNSSNDYMSVKKGSVKLSNDKIIKIIDTQTPFKTKSVNTATNQTELKTFNTNFFHAVQQEKSKVIKNINNSYKEIAKTQDPTVIDDYAQIIYNNQLKKDEIDPERSTSEKLLDLQQIVSFSNRKEQIQNYSSVVISTTPDVSSQIIEISVTPEFIQQSINDDTQETPDLETNVIFSAPVVLPQTDTTNTTTSAREVIHDKTEIDNLRDQIISKFNF